MPIIRGPGSSMLASASNGGTITWTQNPVVGSTVLVGIWANTGTSITSVIDNGVSATTFVQDVTLNVGSEGQIAIYRANAISLPASGSYTVTVTATGATTTMAGGLAYTGVKSGPPTATNHNNNAGSTSVSTGNVTPTNAGALYFAVFVDASGLNPEIITLTAANFAQRHIETNASTFDGGGIADSIDSTGASQCTWTLGDSVGWVAGIAVYDAGPALIQAKSGTSTTSPGSITLNAPTTAGNCLIVVTGGTASGNAPQVTGITLGGSANNFAQAVAAGTIADVPSSIWYDPGCLGGQTAVSVSFSSSGSAAAGFMVMEWTGIAPSFPLDKTALTNSTTSSSWSIGPTATTTRAIEVAIGGVNGATSAAITGPASPWTNLAQITNAGGGGISILTGYQVILAAAAMTYNGSFTASDLYTGVVATFVTPSTPASLTQQMPNMPYAYVFRAGGGSV